MKLEVDKNVISDLNTYALVRELIERGAIVADDGADKLRDISLIHIEMQEKPKESLWRVTMVWAYVDDNTESLVLTFDRPSIREAWAFVSAYYLDCAFFSRTLDHTLGPIKLHVYDLGKQPSGNLGGSNFRYHFNSFAAGDDVPGQIDSLESMTTNRLDDLYGFIIMTLDGRN